jgi:hypothetical protein
MKKTKNNYKKFGKDNSRLVNFDIDDLDSFESMQYDQFSNSMDKADALQILINNVEGDYSQLNEELAEIAEEQYPSDEFFEDNRQYKKGGGVKGFYPSVSFWLKEGVNSENWVKKNKLSDYEVEYDEGQENINGDGDRVNIFELEVSKFNKLKKLNDVVEVLIDNDEEMAQGGSTKGFNYSIGGL